MKHEWKKHDKDLYGAKDAPALVTVPAQNFLMISGKGNPNGTDFSHRVAALYSLAYAVKMDYKSAAKKELHAEIEDFTVYPLEGVWGMLQGTELDKDKLEYTIMIRQPDFITDEQVNAALERVKIKKPNPLYGEIRFDSIHDGKCVEVLHTGPFDDEPASFEKMNRFADENALTRTEKDHREIYLNNAARTAKSKLKTILRYRVK